MAFQARGKLIRIETGVRPVKEQITPAQAAYSVSAIHHEITLPSYHLKYNLWLEDEFDFVALEDDFVAHIEIAMGARRFGLPGKRTPDGILPITEGRMLDGIIRTIEAESKARRRRNRPSNL